MNALPVARHYHRLPNGRRIHYLASGLARKPAVVLLHPSPMSANFMRPVMTALAHRAYVIAPDTPGYGESDALAGEEGGLAPFAAALADLIRALGMKPIVYGSSTGAQIAIELAKAHSGCLTGLVLDNAAHFEDAEREHIVSRYFPSRSPVSDGSHLAAHWLGVRNLYAFFPWFDESSSARLTASVAPLEVLQAQLIDSLRAGDDYDRAYRAAFENERVENVLPIPLPTRIIRWPGSMLWPWMQAFDSVDWPKHIQLCPCGPSLDERMQAILAAFDDLASSASPYESAVSDFATRLRESGAAWSALDEQQALRWRGQVSEKPTLLLHDLGASSHCFADLHKGGLPVLSVDLPGHGGSAGSPAITWAVECILANLKALGVDELSLVGVGLGAAVGAELSKHIPVSKLLAVDAVSPADLPDLQPDFGGGYLQELWYALKDRCLYYPWNKRSSQNCLKEPLLLSPQQLSVELLDMLTSAASLKSWHQELSTFDWTQVSSVARMATWRTPASDVLRMPQEVRLWADYVARELP